MQTIFTLFNSLLPAVPKVIFDPTCGSGMILGEGMPRTTRKFGRSSDLFVDELRTTDVFPVFGGWREFWDTLEDTAPDLKLECIITATHTPGRSSEFWERAMRFAAEDGYGWFATTREVVDSIQSNFIYLKMHFRMSNGLEVSAIHWDKDLRRPNYREFDFVRPSMTTTYRDVIGHYSKGQFKPGYRERDTGSTAEQVRSALEKVQRRIYERVPA